MSEKTHAEIIAEMRNRAKRPDFVSQDVLKSCADRFDAAHRREVATTKESLAVGNSGDCAKLREACANIAEYARSAMCHATDAHVLGYLNQIEGWAKAALSTAPRNCDKYANHNDAMKAFEAFVREQGKLGFVNPYTEAFKWLFAPATEQEGGAK